MNNISRNSNIKTFNTKKNDQLNFTVIGVLRLKTVLLLGAARGALSSKCASFKGASTL